MSQDADEDKQFEASQKKLDDAREKGEIAKSTDLTTAASYGGMVIVVLSIGGTSLVEVGTVFKVMIDQADEISQVIFSRNPSPLIVGVFAKVGGLMAPWFLVPAVLALVSLLGQQAIVFAPSKLNAKLSRISPISGFKNKFGRQGFFEFLKSFVKLLIYGAVLGIYLSLQMDRIIATIYLPPGLVLTELGRLISGLMLIVLAIACVLGLVDYIWQLLEHHRKNRMTRKEMTDEIKQSEGDPMLKHQRRQKGIAIAMNQMLTDVPTADVVIVNPTHYAVALKWDRTSLGAPICVAKGVDEIAARIRELAIENVIPIHSDPPTARSLFASVQIGQEISFEHFAAVAAAIRFAETIRKKAAFK